MLKDRPDLPATRPEHQLLLKAARFQIDEAAIHAVMQSPLDWSYLLELAAWNRVAPLLHHHLNALDLIPPDLDARLQLPAQAHLRGNLFLTGETLRLLREFERAAIPVIVLKGAVLAEVVYGSMTLREFSDIDLLIQEPDLARAADLLRKLGYERGGLQTATCDSCRYHDQFRHVRHDTSVELHWSAVEESLSGLVGSSLLWDGAESVLLRGQPALLPTPEAQVIYLCHHGAAHGWVRLSWVTDVDAVITRYPDLDWQHIMTTAADLSCQLIVRLGVYLAHHLLESPLPDQVQAWAGADPRVRRFAANTMTHLFEAEERATWAIEGRLIQLRFRERWRDRFEFLRCLICGNLKPSPADLDWLQLPRPLYGLYVLLRPLRLMMQYGLPWLRRSW